MVYVRAYMKFIWFNIIAWQKSNKLRILLLNLADKLPVK